MAKVEAVISGSGIPAQSPVVVEFNYIRMLNRYSGYAYFRGTETVQEYTVFVRAYDSLGHVTGRLLLRRTGYEVDMEAILKACAEHHVAVEINCNPNRLELDWRWHRQALKSGCMVSINPDAHSTDEIDLTHWGVEQARKGGVPANRVLNCLTLQQITQHLNKRRREHARAA